MRAGDTIKHKPTNQTMVVSAAKGEEVICAAFGDEPLAVSDCDLLGPCTDAVHRLTLCAVAKQGDTKRAQWAREALEVLGDGQG